MPELLPAVDSTFVLAPNRAAPLVCYVCAHERARWRVRHARYGGTVQDLCALCFMYESGWLTPVNQARVARVSTALSLRRNKVLEHVNGRLVQSTDADDVLGAIVLHDRAGPFLGGRQ